MIAIDLGFGLERGNPLNITINSIVDETPKGLTTGFRLHLNCDSESGKPFRLTTAVLVTKEVVAKRIPLPNLVIAALSKSGLEEYCKELFVDSRHLKLETLSTSEPVLPQTVVLGGAPVLNEKALQKLLGE